MKSPEVRLEPGDIAFFVDLWPNTAEKAGPHPHKEKTLCYTIEGKARPMLVWQRLDRRGGATWYRLSKFTTKGTGVDGKPRKGCQLVGKLVDPEKNSYLELEPFAHPDNLMEPLSSHRPIKRLDQGRFKALLCEVRKWIFEKAE
jgi:hypothetical protein